MDREAFKTVASQLSKGTKVHVRLTVPQLTCPMEFDGKIYDHGPSYIEVGIKGVRGLRRFLFTQLESMELLCKKCGRSRDGHSLGMGTYEPGACEQFDGPFLK